MGAMKEQRLAALPDGAEVLLYDQAEQIAEALHDTQTRIATERGQLVAATAWARLPQAVRVTRIEAVAELLQRGLIAGPVPA